MYQKLGHFQNVANFEDGLAGLKPSARPFRFCGRLLFFAPLFALIGIVSCLSQQHPNAFYQGITAKTKSASTEQRAHLYFAQALSNSNAYTRAAAAHELSLLVANGTRLSDGTTVKLKKEATGSWAAAYAVLDADATTKREKALAFLLSSGKDFPQPLFVDRFPDDAARYVLEKLLEQNPGIFSVEEMAAVNGYMAVSRSRYVEALEHFRLIIETPSLFFQYPELLNALGRSFQYGGRGSEGIETLQSLAEQIPVNLAQADGVRFRDIRFRIEFFSGRIARQRGRTADSVTFFERALPYAPDNAQADACIWYILDSVSFTDTAAATKRFIEYMPQWHEPPYFYDILDKLSNSIVAKRRWKDLATFLPSVLNYADSASVAKYAYLAGRAIENGWIDSDDEGKRFQYMNIAYGDNAATELPVRRPGNSAHVALYFRSESALLLEKPFLEFSQGNSKKENRKQEKALASETLNFLMGFFHNHTASSAPRYIRALEKDISHNERQILAKALGEAGLHLESIRLLAMYPDYEGAIPSRQELELLFPRPYRAIVEKNAKEFNLPPELLFALIRTESAFQSDIVSHAGAIGLTQLMPATAKEEAARIKRQGGPDYTDAALTSPEENVYIGSSHLRFLVDRLESPLFALLAYNAGMNRARNWRNADIRATGGLPEDIFLETVTFNETREYGRKVLGAQAVYKALYYDKQ